MYVMAIDAGTGSCRALVFSKDGQVVGGASREWTHDPEPGVPGSMGFAIDRNKVLLLELVSEAIATAGVAGHDIQAVATTAMREAIVVLDEAGNEVWACANVDARAVNEVRALRAREGRELEVYQTSGQTFALSAQPRLLWLKNHRPELFGRARTLLMLSEWVVYVLSGAKVMEPTNGSTSGLLDLRTRKASDELAAICDLPVGMVPEVVEPGTAVGHVLPDVARATGLSTSCVVAVGGGDAQMATLGAGMVDAGQALVVGGTFWQQEINLPEPVTDPGMRVRINAGPGRNLWQAEAIVFHVGASIKWMRDTFCLAEVEQARALGINPMAYLDQLAVDIPIGSDGVISVFSDAMNYASWKHASPSFLGLNLEGGQRLRAAMFRSLMETAAIVTRENLALVAEFSHVSPQEVLFAGGGAKSALWTQMLADVLGLPVRVPAVTETTAMGAAACAAAAAGWGDTPLSVARSWSSWRGVVEPQPNNTARYRDIAQRWRIAYAAQRQLMEQGVTTPMWQAPGS